MTRAYIQENIEEYLVNNQSVCNYIKVNSYYLDDGMLSMYVACEINSEKDILQKNGKFDINIVDYMIDNAIKESIHHFDIEYDDADFK